MWGKLTDDDLERIKGESEKLVGALQARYGWSREEAEREIERRIWTSGVTAFCSGFHTPPKIFI